jgi:hypothetical protein
MGVGLHTCYDFRMVDEGGFAMDGFVTHQIEGASVDIDVVPAKPHGFCARYRIFRDAADQPEWHHVHVSGSTFDTAEEAEEAARSMALEQLLARGS